MYILFNLNSILGPLAVCMLIHYIPPNVLPDRHVPFKDMRPSIIFQHPPLLLAILVIIAER